MTKQNIEGLLMKKQLESIKGKIAWQIFFRIFGRWVLLAFCALIPIYITILAGSFLFLLLVLPLGIAWWKFARWKTTFIPKQKCPICNFFLTVLKREEETNTNYYLKCNNCNEEISVYTIPLNESID
jgi:hypothetical protein